MAETDKLNIDNIIARLLEGKTGRLSYVDRDEGEKGGMATQRGEHRSPVTSRASSLRVRDFPRYALGLATTMSRARSDPVSLFLAFARAHTHTHTHTRARAGVSKRHPDYYLVSSSHHRYAMSSKMITRTDRLRHRTARVLVCLHKNKRAFKQKRMFDNRVCRDSGRGPFICMAKRLALRKVSYI